MGDTTSQQSAFPPSGPTTLPDVIKSYLYQQYYDDENLHAFVNAQNVMSQWFVDWFNHINLAYYPTLRGDLLDWVAGGLYGMKRPSLSMSTIVEIGGYNTSPYDALAYNEATTIQSTTFRPVNDDVFCRMITWHVYKGDGYLYSTPWLKRRVHRFINGRYGVSSSDDNTFDVSVVHQGTTITIGVVENQVSEVLQYAISDRVMNLPLQYNYQVVFRNTLNPFYPVSARISGVGRLVGVSETLRIKLAGAVINGTGTLRATAFGKNANARIDGTGTLRVIDLSVRLREAAVARLPGTGGVRADGRRLQFTVARVQGASNFIAQPMMFRVVNGALTLVQPEPTWPTSNFGLNPGAVYRSGPNNLTVMVVPGVLPNPTVPPMFYTSTSPAQLLAAGGGNLPTDNPATPDQLWNNNNTVAVSGRAFLFTTALLYGTGSMRAT